MIKHKHIILNVYNASVAVFWGGSKQQMYNFVKKNYISKRKETFLECIKSDVDYDSEGTCYSIKNCPNSIIWLNYFPSSHRGQEVLAHEAIHSAFKIMRHWSIEALRETEEVMTSIVGCIIRETIKR